MKKISCYSINSAFYVILCFLVYQNILSQNCQERLRQWDSIYRDPLEGKNDLHLITKEISEAKLFKCLSDAYRRWGIIYRYNGRIDSAIIYCIRSASIADSLNYSLSAASSYNQIAIIYTQIQNLDQALFYFEKAFRAYSQINHYRGMSDASLNISEILFNKNKTDSSRILCLKSLIYMRQWGDTSTVGYNYNLLSKTALENNNPTNALRYSKQAIQLFKKDNDPPGLLPALNQLGMIFEQLNNSDSALYYFKETYRLAANLGYKENILETVSLLAEVYERQNINDSAILYFKLQQAYSDTLNQESQFRVTTEMLTRFDTERKETALQNEKQLSANRNTMNIALSILSFVLLFSILLMWRSFRQRKKIERKESELQNANAMLKGQDEERERIARELHDRVGSMLSTVKLHFTSMEEQVGQLVKVQHKSYEKAIELLDETYEEVRRISHDLDTGLLGRFGLRTAMLQLAQVIESTNKLKILYLDNDLLPEIYKPFETDLYRITQELLSNTIKYAKAKEISIQLSRNNGNLVYSYEDDGIGFSKEQLKDSKGIGYKNIEARVKKMKGEWHLETSPGNGLNLIIELPIGNNTHHHS